MRIIFYVAVVLVAAVITFTVAFAIWKLSHKYRLYPKIRERDVHTRPTPRLGGVAMFFGVLAAFGAASSIPQLSLVFADSRPVLGLLAAAFIIVALGVADDIFDLDWMTKLAGQIIAAGILAWQGVQLTTLPIDGVTIVSPYISLTLTILAVVLVMNAINFIDGLDGLVIGVAIIANGVFFVYSYLLQLNEQTPYFNLASLTTAVLIGACLGLVPLNFYPARLFIGDAGALLVGLMMAASAITVTGNVNPGLVGQEENFSAYLLPAYIPILLPFAVLIVPLLDFTMAVLRRMRAGKSPFSADRLHLHHRLLDMGHSHLHAVLIFYGWTFVFSVGVLAFMFLPGLTAGLLLLAGLAICTVITLAPLSRRKALEAAAQSTDADEVDPEVARFDTLDEAHDDALDDVDVSELDIPKLEDRT